MIQEKQFEKQADGAVWLNEEGRKLFLEAWQKKKAEVIPHPFLKEKVQYGMLPYAQALLLARYIRGDLDVQFLSNLTANNLLVLITYDVNTETKEGRRRLQKVAKQCVNYGIRVQNSVFECVLDAAEFRKVKQILIDLIDPEKDSLRFYQLGNRYESKVEHIGVRPSLHVEEPLLL